MLVQDTLGKDISIGNKVVISSGNTCYRSKIIKETEKSIGYVCRNFNDNEYLDWVYWLRKSSRTFRGMVKI